jgi:Na+:H+ antiporter, NhaA family
VLTAMTRTFRRFVRSSQAGGALLLACTVCALVLANSPLAPGFEDLRHARVGPLTVEHWINDALMAVFFLLVGLELEREIYVGELSSLRDALLPLIAAAGGMLAPAAIHLVFNAGAPTQSGFGIPMATDIAFALAVLSLLKARVPTELKVFVVAFAVADDLGAVVLIAAVYTTSLATGWLIAGAVIFAALVAMNRSFRIMALWPYLLGGVALWLCLLQGGIHAAVAGVLLAFAIPFSSSRTDTDSPSHRLESLLHLPVAFVILPLFALANTAIRIDAGALAELTSANGLGIALGLILGKPLGIAAASAVAVRTGLCSLPAGMTWGHIVGAGMLGGIGFTMSIFISNLAFAHDSALVESSKLAVLCASMLASVLGLTWLAVGVRRPVSG